MSRTCVGSDISSSVPTGIFIDYSCIPAAQRDAATLKTDNEGTRHTAHLPAAQLPRNETKSAPTQALHSCTVRTRSALSPACARAEGRPWKINYNIIKNKIYPTHTRAQRGTPITITSGGAGPRFRIRDVTRTVHLQFSTSTTPRITYSARRPHIRVLQYHIRAALVPGPRRSLCCPFSIHHHRTVARLMTAAAAFPLSAAKRPHAVRAAAARAPSRFYRSAAGIA